jgi:outer membrane protein assembly factor BamB
MRSCSMVRVRLIVIAAALAAVASMVGGPASAATANPKTTSIAAHPLTATASEWTTFGHDGLRSGIDASGSSFSPATAAWTSPALDGQLYGQPLVATGRVFAATENDTVYALAANTGHVLWHTHVGTPFDPSTVSGLCGNIHPTVGITSTPVIDSARSEIFVVATEAAPGNAVHRLVGLDFFTGAVLLNEGIDPAGTSPAFQLQRASLALTDGRVIAGFGGNSGDCGPYHGLVVSAPEDGSPPSTYVVANQPGDGQGAVWMGGAAPSIDAQGNVWVATGNSRHTGSTDAYDRSDSVLKLSPTMHLLDAFAPLHWYADNATDADLGSTAPALLPGGRVFQVGKSQTGYILNQSHLGGVGGQLASGPFCSADADGGAADLNGTLFVPCGNGLTSVTPSSGPPVAHWTTSSGAHGSPIVAGGLVWSMGGGTLTELNASTGSTVQQFTVGSTPSSFPSPAAADGLVLAPSSDQIHAFVGPAGLPAPPTPPPPRPAYWLVASDGGIFAFGGATFYGSTGSFTLNQPVVAMASTPDHRGYWLVASDGGIFAFGDAGFYGSTGSLHLNRPIVGIAPTPDGRGYWLVASDGGVFNFGDAAFMGSMGAVALNRPVVGIAATTSSQGYWLVASDGGIFAFGDAAFAGSTGSLTLNEPIVGMAATPLGAGYWLVASDGGLFSFGRATFEGSTGSLTLNKPVVGMAATATGDGYWLVASDGGIFSFGDARFEGSTGGLALNRPMVGMAAGAPAS